MKKRWIIVTLLTVTLIAVGVSVNALLASPERALLQIQSDLKERGLEGLENHLTGDAQSYYDTVRMVTNIPGADLLTSLATRNDSVATLLNRIQDISWTLDGIEKTHNSARAIFGFDDGRRLKGAVEISMTRKGNDWLIDKIASPRIEVVIFG